MCISNKVPGGTDAAGLGLDFENRWAIEDKSACILLH